MDIRFQERTLEVINFMNLAVRTHKPKTFDFINHHELNVYPYGARRIALVGVNPDLSEQKVLI